MVQLEYLGDIISAQQIATDHEKIKVMQEWTLPENLKENSHWGMRSENYSHLNRDIVIVRISFFVLIFSIIGRRYYLYHCLLNTGHCMRVNPQYSQ